VPKESVDSPTIALLEESHSSHFSNVIRLQEGYIETKTCKAKISNAGKDRGTGRRTHTSQHLEILLEFLSKV
jgi:hypothetical protein